MSKRKSKALIVSLVLHALLLFVFYMTTFEQSKKQEDEYGAIAVEFSNISTVSQHNIKPKPLKKVEAQKPTEEILTTDNNNISIPKTEEKEKEKKKPKKKKDQYADQTSNLFNNLTKPTENTSNKPKSEIIPEVLPLGDITQMGGTSQSDKENLNAFLKSAGSGTSGGSGYFLSGRGIGKLVKPKYFSNKTGFVVVEIHVDENGKTIYARSGVKGTTITDEKTLENTRKAALNTTWSTKLGVKKQVGYIIYNFKIQ
ncbi:MAG: hypothetical protein ACPG6V_00105 [Flavobacteriales bacterium]